VDISLATAVLYYAAIPYAYDIAVVVIGDQDFKPVLQHVRRLGKRVAIASIKGSCTPEYSDPRDEARVKDFGIIWLDDILDRLALKYVRHQLECQSPMHKGDRLVWTTFYPRRGQKFYCPDCQTDFARQKQEAQREYVSSHVEDIRQAEDDDGSMLAKPLAGVVKKKVADRGFGFIQSSEGLQYFFHLTDLLSDLEFQDVEEGLQVEFEVKREPNHEKAGAAQKVRRRAAQP
jgi:CspA family cold shock protein